MTGGMPPNQHPGSGPIGSTPKPGRTARADASSRSDQPMIPFPCAQVLDVGARLHGMHARQGILAGRVPLHGEEVEAALIAEDVQLLGQVGAVPPTARPLALAAREVEPAPRTLAEPFPPRHLAHLRDHWKPTGRPRAGPKGPPAGGLPPGWGEGELATAAEAAHETSASVVRSGRNPGSRASRTGS
jgi:hypothetical protein